MVKKERGGDGEGRPMSSRMSRVSSTLSSAGSRRTCTPLLLPPINSEPKPDNSGPKKKSKGKKSVHSMQEVQQLAKLREQQFLRSAKTSGSSDTLRMPAIGSEAGGHTEGKREKRKRNKDLLDISQACEKIGSSKTATTMREAKMAVEAGIGESRFPPAKLPKLGAPKLGALDNNIIDVINRHEATVKVKSKVMEITQDYMKAVAQTFPAEPSNNAPEIIASNEDGVGKAYMGMTYDEYTLFYDCPGQGSRSRVGSGSGSRSMSRCRSAASGKSY